jgi:plastocyanin
MLFVFAAGFPPFDDITEVDLTLHMLQHVLIVLAGVAVSYPIFRRRMEPRRRWAAWLSLVLASALIVFWHLPAQWDAAVLDPLTHAVEHLSFLLVGVLIGAWIQQLSDSAKIGALSAAFFGHMLYAVLLISPWNFQVYPLFSLANQQILGWALLLTGPSLIVGIVYVVARNPTWLGGFTGKTEYRPRMTFINSIRVPRWTPAALTLLLVLTTVGYFGMTALALAGGRGGTGPSVQIVESPLSWQYSPQRITVKLGVNSTVTWESRSISYDTVTSRSGDFDSGPIPPGGTYSYTFAAPGTYDYYCAYHPWMTGQVVVVP